MMATNGKKRVTRYLNSSALTRPLITVGAVSAVLAGAAPAHALDASALPQDPTLAGGNATFAQSGKTLNVTQTSNRAVIDWRSFNIGSEAQTNFNQPNSGSIAVNRVNASANPTQIEGGLHANGQVWILNPNGVMFGKTAHVDAAGIVASTANIDTARFMAGDNRLNLTGADKGSVVNDGSITVGKNGLAAFVAPSVRNSGTITARVGKVALAAGTTFTLDLAGDQLVEIGLGAGKAVVDQSGKIVNAGGTVTLTARAAGQVVDSVVNMSGVTRTASARKVGGDIVLDGDTVTVAGTADASGTSGGNIAITGKTITVASSAVLRGDAGSNGDGGTIKAVAAGQGTYAGSYSAKGGSTGGNGGTIETSGETVHVSADAKIDASAPHGNAGTWLLDPLNITIAAGTGGGLSGATVTTGAIQSTLAGGTSVTITTSQTGTDVGDLTLAGSINATSTGNAGLTLTGRHLSATGGSTINIAGGALTLNVNAVNRLADVSNQPTNWIQDADNMVGTVSGGSTITLGAGIYAPGAVIDRSNLVLDGSAGARINIDPGNGQVIGLGIGGGTSGVTIKGFTIVGEITGSYVDYAFGAGSSRGIFAIQNATNFTIDHNNISNVRTGILVDGRNVAGSAITNNVIDNTKTAALLQYTAGEGINISGNSQGVFGNEWGGNFHVNGYYNGTALVSAPLGAASSGVQSALLANSAANAGWAVQDQGYATSNRTVVFVNPTGLDSNQGSAKAKLASIQAGINAVVAGGTVNVNDGTYVISNSAPYINVNKSLNLIGQSQAGTIIDARSANTYGLRISGPNSNVTVQNFTLYGVTSGTFQYGLKAENVTNLVLRNITSQGAGKSEFDLNGILGGTLDNLTANGASVAAGTPTAGNGISIMDSQNVTLANSTTLNNVWGGLALYQSNDVTHGGYTYQEKNITVAGNNNFTEVTPIYAQDESATNDFGALTLTGYNYIVQSPSASGYGFFQKTQQGAVDYAAGLSAATAIVQGYAGNGLAGNNTFTVGISNGTALSIQTAINAANTGAIINVLDGTYAVPATLGITKSLSLVGQSQAGTILNASGATTYSLRVQADNVSLSNFTLLGSTVASAYGIKVEPLDLTNQNSRINNFAISNVTINGSNKSALDINGAHIATINNVTAKNAAAGVGIAIVDSSNVTVTNSTTQGNAWGGVRIEEKNATSNGINQQTDAITVDATNTFNEAVPLYMEDNSASQNFGTVTISGLPYIVRANAVSTWFQKTQQDAVNYAANTGLASAYVQGWNGTAGNNIFTVGIGTLTGGGTKALSIQTAVNAATAGGTVNVLSGTYTLSTKLSLTKSLSLIGAGASTIITSNSTEYGIAVTGNNVRLSSFTLNGPTAVNNATYGIKVQPGTTGASDRILGFAIDNVTINRGYRTGLDVHAANGATIDKVSVSNIVNGNGIGLTDSANVTITNTTTSNNAWGGLAIYQANRFYNQQVNGISVDAISSFNEANGIYAENQSLLSLDIGTLALAGFNYVVKSPNNPADVYTFFQKTPQGAINFATDALLNGGRVSLSTATVQGYAGNSVAGNNSFTVGIGSNGTALSIQTAVNAASTGATVTVLDGTYVIPGAGNWLEINKSLSLVGQSQASTIINGSGASGYGMRVEADNVSLSNFTLLGATGSGSFGLKVQPVDGSGATARINNFAISNVTINGAYKSALDITAVNHATIDHVTAENVTNGVGIALVDSANVAVTNSTTLNNAWGGVRIEEKNSAYNQQTTAVSVDASNTLNEAVPLYMEDNSATQDFGTVTIGGLGYIVRADAVSTFFQKTQQNAVDYAANLNPVSAYVEGWSGSAVNNIFTVGISSGGTTLSLQSALNASTTGATVNMLSGSYAGSIVGNGGTNFNFGTVSLGGSFILNGAATLSGNLSASSIALNGAVTLAGATTLNTSAANGSIVTAAINGSTAGGQSLTILSGTGTVSLGSLGATTRLGAVSNAGITTLTGGTYNAGSLSFGGLTLAAATTLNTSVANGVIVTGAIDGSGSGGQALTINAGSGSVSLGSLGASGIDLGAVNDASATTLTGGTYNANSLNFGALTLTNNTSLNAFNGAIVTGAINGTIAGGQALTINAGNGKVSLGSLGATTRLGAVSDSSVTTLTGGTYNANSLNFGALTLAAATTLNASGAIVIASVDGNTAGGQALTISTGSGVVRLGSLGATTRLGAVNDTSFTTLTGGTYNANSLNFGALSLLNGTSLNTSAANGVIVTGAINVSGGQALTINAGSGSVSLGSLGADGIDLGAVNVAGATTLTGGTYNASSLNFGALTLTSTTSLIANGAIVTGAINGTTAGGQALTINAGSGKVSLGSLGAGTRLGAVNDNSATTLTGGTYNANSLNFGALTLTNNTSLNAFNGAIVTGAINGTTAGGQALTINAGSGKVSLGSLGAGTRLGAVTDASTTTLTGDTYAANSLNFAGDVTLTAATTTMDTSPAAGDITVSGNIFGTSDGKQNLILAAGSGTGSAAANGNILVQNVGVKGTLALGDLTISGNNFGAQTVSVGNFKAKLVGNQVFSSHTLNASGTVDSTIGGSASGPINAAGAVGLSVSGDVTGAIVGHAVILNAGSITGATVTGTNTISITANSVGSSTLTAPTVSATAATFNTNVNASNVVLNAGTIDGSTITGSQNITVTANNVGTSSFTAPTVGATATNFNSAVNASSAANISGGTVAGTFSGGSFTLTGSTSVNATVSAKSTNVSSSVISGSYSGEAVSLSGSTSVNATVASNSLSVQSPSGKLAGTWDSISTGASGTLVVNNQVSVGSGNTNPNQIVVENFVLPTGTRVTSSGSIILPQGLMIGLLSPGGGASSVPKLIQVQDVYSLGSLLSSGYTAIIIDLTGTKKAEEKNLRISMN